MSRTSRSSALTADLFSCRPTSHNSLGASRSHARVSLMSSGTPCPSSSGRRGGTPCGQFFQRLANLGGAGCELLGAERRQAHSVAGINLAVPLLHPRLHLGQPRDQRDEPLVVPAFLLPLPDDQRQRQRLLRMIPPRPADYWRGIGLPARLWIEDEPLLGHVQLAPRLPVGVLPKVRRGVLRRHRDRADLLPGILTALESPRLLPGLALAQPGILVPVRRQIRHRLIGK